MKKGERFSLFGRYVENSKPPMPLEVAEGSIAACGAYGDIVTLGSKEHPARDWRTGIPVPHDQRFILTRPK